MLLYKDILTGDEMVSDAFPLKTVDDVAFEVDGSTVTIGGGVTVDIGANASAEEVEEGLEENAETAINVVHNFRLQSTQFDKKSYLTYLKGYMKKVKAHLEKTQPDRVETFEKGAQTLAKKVVANFKDYEFFTGESMDPDGMIVLLNYREDGTTPFFTFWIDGLNPEKF